MRARRSAALLALLLAAGGASCTRDVGAPRLLAMEPRTGTTSRATPVIIRGERLAVDATVGTDGRDGDRVDASYRAWLGGKALEAVRWRDEATLEAVVPAGLAEGSHDLVVEAPDGTRLALPAAFAVRRPAELLATLRLPRAIPVGDFTVRLEVANVGGSAAVDVTPLAPAPAPDHTADVAFSEAVGPASASLLPGEAVTFAWILRAGPGGAVALEAGATGRDAPSLAPIAAPAATAGPVPISAAEVATLLVDPFGDGSPFAQVLEHAGAILLAPSADGRAAMRLEPLGGTAEPLALALARDEDPSGGSQSANGWTGAVPYPSLGAPGCTLNTAACGPDNEEGRGLWAAGDLGGAPWLLASATPRQGALRHLYLSPGEGTTLDLRFVDVAGAVTTPASQLTSARFAGDRLYLGLAARHPYLLALVTAPPAPGLEPGAADLVDLELDLMPGAGSGGVGRSLPVAVDAIAVHGGLVHVATALGLARATTPAPRPYSEAPEDWLDVTPAAPEWARNEPARGADLLPGSRAVPSLVAAAGSLLLARNTVAGPQLWACRPARTGPAETCESADWELAARDPTGDLSRLGRSDLGPLSLLAAAGDAVFVGYDAPAGFRIFRASAAAGTLAPGDFTGVAGCIAPDPACEGLGGAGFGRGARLPRVLDAQALAPGGALHLYVVAGDGVAPARVHRLLEPP